MTRKREVSCGRSEASKRQALCFSSNSESSSRSITPSESAKNETGCRSTSQTDSSYNGSNGPSQHPPTSALHTKTFASNVNKEAVQCGNSQSNGGDGMDGPPRPESREQSHDGTVAMPRGTAGIYKIHRSGSLELLPDAFPIFRKGNVLIGWKVGQESKVFLLHSTILARSSGRFSRIFGATDANGRSSKWFVFELHEDTNSELKLVPGVSNASQPSVPQESLNNGCGKTHIKEEVDGDANVNNIPLTFGPAKTLAVHSSNGVPTINAYVQILGLFYNIPLNISTTDVQKALTEAEALVKVAHHLDCLSLLRPHLSNTFGQYRQKLYIAIKGDPARWIKIAKDLKDSAVFTESLIHLVGAHPYWPWPTKRTCIDPEIRQLITRKARALDQKCVEAERELLMNTIQVRDGPVSVDDVSQRETWFTVQVFRDILASHLHAMGDGKQKVLGRGGLFRNINNKGSNYMAYEKIRRTCEALYGSEWRDLGEDLGMLKERAALVVQELAGNELMIDPDANGVGYLTCVKVLPEDMPWQV